MTTYYIGCCFKKLNVFLNVLKTTENVHHMMI